MAGAMETKQDRHTHSAAASLAPATNGTMRHGYRWSPGQDFHPCGYDMRPLQMLNESLQAVFRTAKFCFISAAGGRFHDTIILVLVGLRRSARRPALHSTVISYVAMCTVTAIHSQALSTECASYHVPSQRLCTTMTVSRGLDPTYATRSTRACILSGVSVMHFA